MWSQLFPNGPGFLSSSNSAAAIGLTFALLMFLGSLWLMGRRSTPRPRSRKTSLRLSRAIAPAEPVRRRGAPVAVLVRYAEQEFVLGRIVDRSVAGLCLEVDDEPIARVGDLLRVRTSDSGPVVPWVEIHMKECRVRKNCWELDCVFARTPPWSVRMLFG